MRKKENLIIFFICLIIFFNIIFGIFLSISNEKRLNNNLEPIIKEITQNTKIIDENTDHNQNLDVIDYAKRNNIEIPSIMINFDTHSDVYINYPTLTNKNAGVENWINELISKNQNLDEIYWVMPKQEAKNLNLITIFINPTSYKYLKIGVPLFGNTAIYNINQLSSILNFIYKPIFVQNFLVDTNSGLINEVSDLEYINNEIFNPKTKYKTVKFITCTEDTLPDFTNKKILLSIDADYTSNSGFDTVDGFKFIPEQKDIDKTFRSIFNTLKNKNVKPEIITLSLSPQYLPKKHHNYVSNYFKNLIKMSGKKDVINSYKRFYDTDPNYLEKTYRN